MEAQRGTQWPRGIRKTRIAKLPATSRRLCFLRMELRRGNNSCERYKSKRIESRGRQRSKFFRNRQAQRKRPRTLLFRIKQKLSNRRLACCSKRSIAPQRPGNLSFTANPKMEIRKPCRDFSPKRTTGPASGKNKLDTTGREASGLESFGSFTAKRTTKNIASGLSCGARNCRDRNCRRITT